MEKGSGIGRTVRALQMCRGNVENPVQCKSWSKGVEGGATHQGGEAVEEQMGGKIMNSILNTLPLIGLWDRKSTLGQE